MADTPKHPMRFPWEQMRADIASGAVRTWGDLQAKYGCSESGLLKRRAEDKAAGNPWPPLLRAAKTGEPQAPSAPSNVLPFARSSTPKPTATPGAEKPERPASAPPRRPHLRSGTPNARIDDESLLDSSEPPLVGEEKLDGNLSGQPITAGLLDQFIHGVTRKLIRGKVKPSPYQSQADVWNLGMDAIKKASMLQREIAGKKSGQPSVPGEDATKPKTLRFVVADEETSEAG